MTPISKFEIFYNPLKLKLDLFEKNSINNSRADLNNLETLNNEVAVAVNQCLDDDKIDYDMKDRISTSLWSLNERIEELIEKNNFFAKSKPIALSDVSYKLFEALNQKIIAIEKKTEQKYHIFNDISSDRFQLDKIEMKIENFKSKYLSNVNPEEKFISFNELNIKINALKLQINSLIKENWKENLNINNLDRENTISINEARDKYDQKGFRILVYPYGLSVLNEKDIDSAFEIAKSTPHKILRASRLREVSDAYLRLNTEECCKKSYKAMNLSVFDAKHNLIHLNTILENRKPIKTPEAFGASFALGSCLKVKTPYTIHLARKIFDQYSLFNVGEEAKLKDKLEALEKTLDVFYEENLYIRKFEYSPKNKIFNTLWRGIYDSNSHMQNDPFPREIIGVIFEKCLKLNF